jgi:hypothetical protein
MDHQMAFSQQSLETELKDLSVTYGPPNGKTLLAVMRAQVKPKALKAL